MPFRSPPTQKSDSDGCPATDETTLCADQDSEWITEHYPSIHRAAWLMTGNTWEAEDLAQETFVVALERRESFRGDSKWSTWLHGILVRLVRHRQRRHVRMRRRLMKYVWRKPIAESVDPSDQLAESQWKESIWADVARLPSNQRISLVLRFADGLSYDEIAQITCTPVGTVKSRIHHGLKKLASLHPVPRQTNQLPSPSSTETCPIASLTEPRLSVVPGKRS